MLFSFISREKIGLNTECLHSEDSHFIKVSQESISLHENVQVDQKYNLESWKIDAAFKYIKISKM